ncbi:MAG: 1-deoxy-D-xylulose-5-phosphate reductoisomerase [Bacteroidetes bacterium]|nr:1-deoxy-D-xylulose-5-phosphate reductoisomerase [Bacteroidota bacterium]
MSDDRIRVAILGSTGSIGTQTLEIARLFPDRIQVVALTAGKNVDLLAQQAKEFNPECVVIGSHEAEARAIAKGRFNCPVFFGEDELSRAATWDRTDVVVTALVGSIGLLSTVAAIKTGCRIALANKETLVIAGDLIADLAKEHQAEIIPVDSEHSAIYQCLMGESLADVSRLILTASGGPFRERPIQSFSSISTKEALSHPNWAMGPKITIDSATMINKGLEVIEARWLFNLPADKIEVVIHPQSIIHSMVEFVDGSTKAQMGPPDMKVPIQFALSTPGRWPSHHPVVSWKESQNLTFTKPDLNRYPGLSLAFEALKEGGSMPAVLNASNEVAVDLFLQNKIGYLGITDLVRAVMQSGINSAEYSIEARLEVDRRARRCAEELAGITSH